MSTYLSLYMDNPTQGQKDGTLVSENMIQTSPLSVTLNATENESKSIKVALRCEDGYRTSGATVVGFKYWDGSVYQDEGGNVSKWKVAKYTGETEPTTWADSLVIEDIICAENYCFWVKASASSDEKPQTDRTVGIHIEGIVEADETASDDGGSITVM